MDVTDIESFRPHDLWWLGYATVNDGVHVSLSKLRQLGYLYGADARRALLKRLRHNLRLDGKTTVPQKVRI